MLNKGPRGAILSQDKRGSTTEELLKGALLSQDKFGDVDPLKENVCLSVGHAIAAEQFFRITEQGIYRILEENLDLRVIEDAPISG